MDLPTPNVADESLPSSAPQPTIVVSASPSTSNPKKVGGKLLMLIGSVVFGLLVIGFGVVSYLAAYTEIKVPMLSSNMKKNLTVMVYKIPLLPKTPRQILTAAAETDKVLTSYTADFSFSAKVGGTALSAGSFDLQFKGPLDFTNPENPKFDIDASTHLDMFGTKVDLSGKVRGLDKIVYFKLDEIPVDALDNWMSGLFGTGFRYSSYGSPNFEDLSNDQIAENLKSVTVNWISYEPGGLDTQARKALEENSKNQSIIESARRKMQSILSDSDVIPEIKLLGSEKVNGAETYHLQVSPTRDSLKRVMSMLMTGSDTTSNKYNEEMIDGFISASEAVVIDAWFGKTDALLRKVSAQALINTGSMLGGMTGSLSSPTAIMGTLGAGNVSLSLVLGLSDIGKSADISVPSPVLNYTEYGKLFSEAMMSPQEKEWKSKSEKYNTDFTAISKGLLRYYVDNAKYPNSLQDVFGSDYSEYQYRITRSGHCKAHWRSSGSQHCKQLPNRAR